MSQGSILKLTKESVVYGLGQAIGRGLQMLLVPLFTRVFRPDEYGVIDVIALVTSIAAFLIIMGTDVALARFFYERKDAAERREFVSTFAGVRLIVSLAFAGILFAFAPAFSNAILASPDYVKYVRIAALSLPFSVFVFFQNDVLRVTFQPWKFIALNILDTVAVSGLSILFVLGMHREVSGVLYARLIGDAIAVAAGFVLIRHSLVPVFRRSLIWEPLRFGLFLLPASVAFWAISYADRWFLVRFTDLTAVGIYAVAVKLGTLMMLLISAFQLAWGPFAYAHAHEPHAKRLFARVVVLFTAVASGIALAVGLVAPEVLAWLVPASYHGAAAPGTLLAFGVVAFGVYTAVGIGANIEKRTHYQLIAAFTAAAVTIALAFTLVRPFRLMGVAAATLVGFAVSAALMYRLSQRVWPIPPCGGRATALFGLALLAWIGGALAASALEQAGHYPVGIAARVAAFAIYAAAAAWLARRIAPVSTADGPLVTAGEQLDPMPVASSTEAL